MNPQGVNPNDPDVIDLARAIINRESGGDFNAVGDAGTSHGVAQWQDATWKAQAQTVLGDPNAPKTPENQKAVLQASIAIDKAAGLNPAQIAAKWNSGQPDGWENKVGSKVINGQVVHYNVPAYVKHVTDEYQRLKMERGGGQQIGAPMGGFMAPPAMAASGGGIPGYAPPVAPEPYVAPQEAGMAQQQQGAGGVEGVAGGIVDFLFPILGDVKNIVEGDNEKNAAQLAGSLGLSVLPFIPGLGWGGKAVQGAAMGAKAVKGAEAAAKGGGLLSKFFGSKVGQGALAGYGTGVSANLNEGKGVAESFGPDANTIGGTAFGGAAPALLQGVGGLAKKFSGITPQIENELRALGAMSDPQDVQLYNKYITATKQHATDVRAKAPLTIAADELDNAANQITKLTKAAGVAVGEAKKAGANLEFVDNPEIFTNFDNMVADRFGLKLSPIQEAAEKGAMPVIDFTGEAASKGTKYAVHPIAGSLREVEPGVANRVAKVAEQISKLRGASVKQASEIINNLNELVDFTKVNAYGKVNDPLEGVIKKAAGEINEAIRKSSPEIAQANDVFSALKGLQEEIGGMAGKNLQKGELLMRRVFSGDKSGDVNDLFQKIKDITGIDLIKHAVLAKHAIQSVGSQADKTLLEQIIETGIESKTGGLLGGLMNLGRSAAQGTFANPETIGRELILGKQKGLLSDWFTTGAIEASRGVAPATGN